MNPIVHRSSVRKAGTGIEDREKIGILTTGTNNVVDVISCETVLNKVVASDPITGTN